MSKSLKSQSFLLIHNQLEIPRAIDNFQEGFSILNLKEIGYIAPYKSPVIRPEYFSILFVKKGSGEWITEQGTYVLQPYTINFANVSLSREFSYTSLDEVYIVTFDEYFLKNYVRKNIYDEFPFLLTEKIFPINSQVDFYKIVEGIYLRIYREYSQNSTENKYKIIGHLMAVMLYYFKDNYWRDYNPVEEGRKTSKIVLSFKRLLELHYQELNEGKVQKVFKVRDYAEAQNFHPNYLSSVIRIKTGKPIAAWIAEKTISEAKILLHTNVPIKEIVYKLGFSDVSHFNKIFKKHTQSSPNQYRKSHRFS